MADHDLFFARTGMDRLRVQQTVDQALRGADDGELYLEFCQSESFSFDDGRLRAASFDTSQGFGLRAVAGEATGYAHASDISEDAIARADRGGGGGRGTACGGGAHQAQLGSGLAGGDGDDVDAGAADLEIAPGEEDAESLLRRIVADQGRAAAAGHDAFLEDQLLAGGFAEGSQRAAEVLCGDVEAIGGGTGLGHGRRGQGHQGGRGDAGPE